MQSTDTVPLELLLFDLGGVLIDFSGPRELGQFLRAPSTRSDRRGKLVKRITATMDAETREGFEQVKAMIANLTDLVQNVSESLSREIGDVKERVDRMSVRLDKIAAGAHYVTRLVEWSEKQDKFQEDILRRVQVIEHRLDIRPEAQ